MIGKQQFSLKSFVTNLTLGLVAGLDNILVCLSSAALLFSGPFANHFLMGVCILLISASLVLVGHALFSVFPTVQTAPQKQPIAILSTIAASIAALDLGASAFPTFLGVMLTATLVTAIVALVMGRIQMGNLIRYIPYPVTAGFLAGTGWVLIYMTLCMLSGTSLSWSTMGHLGGVDVLCVWVPAAFLAGIFLFMTTQRNLLLIPILLLMAIVIFYGVLWVLHMPYAEIAQHGWLLGPFQANRLWTPPNLELLRHVDGWVLLHQSNSILVLGLLSILECMLISSIIELNTGRTMDINRELRVFGWLNMCSASVGGVLCSIVPGTSAFEREGGTSRMIGVLGALCCIFVLFAGTEAIAWIPRYTLGGLLLYFGSRTLSFTVYRGWKELSRIDFFTLLSIVVVIAFFGLVQGALLGVIISIILFVVNYSRIDVVKYTLTGETLKSSLQRTPVEQSILKAKGAQLYYLKLHGYIFFGTANRLFDRIDARLQASPSFHYLILDFASVDGLDSSAAIYIAKLEKLAADHDFTLIFTQASAVLKKQLRQAEIITGEVSHAQTFDYYDDALEWCEEHILQKNSASIPPPVTLSESLSSFFIDNVRTLQDFFSYFERVAISAGTYLCHQGEPADCLFFIESGLIAIEVDQLSGATVRLRKIGVNNIIGEMGLYLNAPRFASMYAEEDTVLYRLSRSSLERMEQQHSDIAGCFHRFVIGVLAERIAFRNEQVRALMQ